MAAANTNALKWVLLCICAAAVMVLATPLGGSDLPPSPGPQVSLLADQGSGAAGTQTAGGLPRTAWKDIRTYQSLRAAEKRALAEPSSALVCPEPASCRQEFGTEVVRWTAASGALALHSSVEALSRRADFAYLGEPVTSEYATGAVYRTDFEHGSLIRVPELNRIMTSDAAVSGSAVVIGDSQTGTGTWIDQGLSALNFRTVLRGAGGTGYIQGNGSIGSYYTALTEEQWVLPWGTPALVVLQGGGNDAGKATDAEIAAAAAQMIKELRRTYPQSRLVMVGVISSGRGPAGSRRTAVDSLLAGVAEKNGVEFLSVGDWWTKFGLGDYLQPDGRHFTTSGHQLAGHVLARELGALLAR